MELLFIRHGHGEHLLDYPTRLHTLHPALTEYGKLQCIELSKKVLVDAHNDVVIVSPTKRTIETAQILSNHTHFIVSPIVGPRMFPQNYEALLCDQIYTKNELTTLYKDVQILDFGFNIWEEGINRIAQELFEDYARRLLHWCQEQRRRVIFVSHDGTITNYRLLLGEKGLTRNDFLGEAGVYEFSG